MLDCFVVCELCFFVWIDDYVGFDEYGWNWCGV